MKKTNVFGLGLKPSVGILTQKEFYFPGRVLGPNEDPKGTIPLGGSGFGEPHVSSEGLLLRAALRVDDQRAKRLVCAGRNCEQTIVEARAESFPRVPDHPSMPLPYGFWFPSGQAQLVAKSRRCRWDPNGVFCVALYRDAGGVFLGDGFAAHVRRNPTSGRLEVAHGPNFGPMGLLKALAVVAENDNVVVKLGIDVVLGSLEAVRDAVKSDRNKATKILDATAARLNGGRRAA